MKEKGFDRPVKYIFIGQPNTTKTTLAFRAAMKVFETDGLAEEEILDIKFYPRDTDVIIVGGKWIKHQLEIITMLSEELREDYQLIQVRFTSPVYDTLKFFIERTSPEETPSDEGGYAVYISTTDRILQVVLNNDDGYRSHADVIPDEEVDGFKFWLKMEGGKQKVFEVEYDQILFGFSESTQADYSQERGIIVRAKLLGRVVFEIGTDNTDDYYPNYYLKWGEKGLDETLKESKIDVNR